MQLTMRLSGGCVRMRAHALTYACISETYSIYSDRYARAHAQTHSRFKKRDQHHDMW